MIPPLLKNQLTLRVEEPTVFRRAMLKGLLSINPWLSKNAADEILEEGTFTGPEGQLRDKTLLMPGLHPVCLDETSAIRATLTRLSPNENSEHPKILYECSDFWVLSKRSGQQSLPLRLWQQGSVVQDALRLDPGLAEAFQNRLELGAVHRLDQGTSGCFLFARNPEALTTLRNMFATQEVSKIYSAWCYLQEGATPPPSLIDDPIVHLKKSSKRMGLSRLTRPTERRGTSPQPARSRILEVTQIQEGLVRVQIQIETGVRHQIRLHMASVGLPLVGDSVYDRTYTDRIPKALRLGLHASKIGFSWKGKKIEIASEDLQLSALFGTI